MMTGTALLISRLGNIIASQQGSVAQLLREATRLDFHRRSYRSTIDAPCLSHVERYLNSFAWKRMEADEQLQVVQTETVGRMYEVSRPTAKDARTRSGVGCNSR
jgi:hypothetical protein